MGAAHLSDRPVQGFRCSYCMPNEIFGRDFMSMPRGDLLAFEEITRLSRLFAARCVKRIRLASGQLLLRNDFQQLVELLAGIDGIADIGLTTNPAALAAKGLAGPASDGDLIA